jgi:hypothetical protein
LVSDVTTVGKDPQRAAAVFYALDEGEPIFGILGTVSSGGRVVGVMAMLDDLERQQAAVAGMISYLQLETAVSAFPDDVQSGVLEQLLGATSLEGEPAATR